MSSKLVRKFTCDFCNRSVDIEEKCHAGSISPKGWGQLFYEFVNENGVAKSSTMDICGCCLKNEDTRIMLYPGKMNKEGNHAPD